MSLYLVIGSATSDACTVRVSSRSIKPFLVNQFIVAYEHQIVFEGYLYANGPMALSAAMLSLENAVAVENVTVGLATEYGSTQHWLSSTGAIGGVIKAEIAFEDTPLHMATQVKYRLTANAMYGATSSRSVVELNETTTVTGDGGPKTVLASQAGAPSIYQTVADYTNVQVVQSGKITARTLPLLPSPLITDAGALDSEQSRDSISYTMKGASILLYHRDYSYTFNLPTYPGVVLPGYLT